MNGSSHIPDFSDNPFYLQLYQLAHQEDIQHIVEIGSANGSGSTQVLVQALQARCQEGRGQLELHCFESQKDNYTQLIGRYQGIPWLHAYDYFSCVPVEYPSEETIRQFCRDQPTVLRRYPLNEIFSWLENERQSYLQNTNPVSGIAWLKTQLGVEHFDMVVLDGAEFTGQADLDAVYGARILVLDDALGYKNWHNYQRLKHSSDYVLIREQMGWQHGMAVFKRRQAYRPGLCAVVHTLNAVEQLESCLESLQFCDQILVIDMYSQDQTAALAERHGATVYRHLPVDCVDEARNWGLSLVPHAWTLVVDADERIPQGLAQRILTQIQDPASEDGFWLPRQNIFFSQAVPSLFPDFQMRLFRSQQAFWRGLVHELPELFGRSARFPAEPDFAIQHYSYPDVESYWQRQIKYAQTMWKQLAKYPGRPTLLDAHHLRQHIESQQQQFLDRAAHQSLDNLEWLVRQLYIASSLATSALFLEQTGQVKGQVDSRPIRLSAYSYLKNAVSFDYPWRESLLSVMEICDELIVSYASDSSDQTTRELLAFAAQYPKLKLFESHLWETQRPDGETIRLVAEEAMAACDGDWLWHVQADEVYNNQDCQKIRNLIGMYHAQAVHGFIFKMIHFYGDYQTAISPQAASIGWYQQSIRLTRQGWGQHQGDAWTMALKQDAPNAIIMTDVKIYHYGHVREKEAMRLKSNYMERLYHDLPAGFAVCEPGQFEYNKVDERYLLEFDLPHPESMQLRIAQTQTRSALAPYSKKPKLLILSRYHQVKKGFGITLNNLYQTTHLQSLFDVHHLAWHYEDAPKNEDGVHIYPCPDAQSLSHWRDLIYLLQPDVILLHADAHFYLPYLEELTFWKGPVVGWFTIDFERDHNPKRLLPLFERCQRILSMADASLQQLRKDYAGPLAKVPLGVDHASFYPVSAEQKQNLRRQLGVPHDEFIFLVVANNFWRKGIEYAVFAMAEFVKNNPEAAEKTTLYLHCESSDGLIELINAYGLKQRVRMSKGFDPYKQPFSQEDLLKLYHMSDAFLLTTLGEGFGMPVLEAQACGLPLIISDNSVLREVGGEAALYIRCPGYVGGANAGAHVWMRPPDPHHAAELMTEIRRNQSLRQKLSQKGLEQAQAFSWQKTVELLGAELAKALGTGKLVYDPPEPTLRAV